MSLAHFLHLFSELSFHQIRRLVHTKRQVRVLILLCFLFLLVVFPFRFFLLNRRRFFFLSFLLDDLLRLDDYLSYLGSIFHDSFFLLLFFLLLLIFLYSFLLRRLNLLDLYLLTFPYYFPRLLCGIPLLFALFVALLFLLCVFDRLFSSYLFLVLLFFLGNGFLLLFLVLGGCFHNQRLVFFIWLLRLFLLLLLL